IWRFAPLVRDGHLQSQGVKSHGFKNQSRRLGVAMRRAMRSRNEQPEDGVNLRSCNALAQYRINTSQHINPYFEIRALETAHRACVIEREVGEVVILDSNQIPIAKREVGVECDE